MQHNLSKGGLKGRGGGRGYALIPNPANNLSGANDGQNEAHHKREIDAQFYGSVVLGGLVKDGNILLQTPPAVNDMYLLRIRAKKCFT